MTQKVYSIGEIRSIVAPIAQRHGVQKVYLFGSYARGEATPYSDVDLCVDAPSIRLDLVTTNTLGKETNADFSENLRKDQVLIYELAQ